MTEKQNPSGLGLTLALLLSCLPLAPAVADRQQAALYYEEAVVYHKAGKIEAAIIQLKNALQQDPGLLPARVLLGSIHMENGAPGAAEKELREAEQLGADRNLTAVPLARAYLKQHKYAELISELTLLDYPAGVHGELLTYHGHAQLEQGDLKAAQQAFQRAAALLPDAAAPLNGLALLALRSGDIAGAIAQAERALRLEPDNSEALNIHASAIHAGGELAQAAEGYGAVLRRDPQHMEARLARAGVYIDLKQFDQALADLEFMERNYPMEPRALYLKSLIHGFRDEPQAAKEALLKSANILKALPPEFLARSRQHLMLAGLTYYALDNLELAQRYLEQLLLLTPEAAGPKKLLAAIHMRRGDHSEVIRLLQPLVDRGQGADAKVLTLLGRAYSEQGRYDRAAMLLEQAVALSGDATGARTSLALNYYDAGAADKAVTELAAVFEQARGDVTAGIALATIHLKQNHPREALEILGRIAAVAPDDVTYHNLMGTAQVMARQFDAARSTFLALEAAAPDFIPAKINLARLDNLTGQGERARQRLRALLLDKNAPAGQIMLELARTEELAGNLDEAIRWAEKLRAEESDNLAARRYLIDIYHRSGAHAKALEIALEAKRLTPEALEILQIVAQSYITLGNPRAARTELLEMSALAGFDARWLYRIARLQYDIQAYKEAEYSLQKAVQEAPDFMEAQVALIEILIGLDKLDAAQARILSLRDRPGFDAGERLQGDIALRRGAHQQALHHYQAAMQRSPSALLNLKLYQAHGAAGDWSAAIALMQRWLKDHPDDLNARLALAEAYLRGGDHRQAGAAYEALLQQQPDNSLILGNLAFIYLHTGDDRALDTARRAQQLAPQDAAVNDTLGWILVSQGEAQQGLPYLREAHSRAANNPEIRYHIAVALIALGRHEEAQTELALALAAARPFEGIDQARALQAQLGGGGAEK